MFGSSPLQNRVQLEEMARRRGLAPGGGLVNLHAQDCPELKEAPVLGLLMALLRLTQAVVHVGCVGTALYLNRYYGTYD